MHMQLQMITHKNKTALLPCLQDKQLLLHTITVSSSLLIIAQIVW